MIYPIWLISNLIILILFEKCRPIFGVSSSFCRQVVLFIHVFTDVYTLEVVSVMYFCTLDNIPRKRGN